MTEDATSRHAEVLPGFIDRAWIADALAESGVAGDATLVDIDFEGWIGTGQMARNGRIALRWDDPRGRPSSVVVKVPSSDPDTSAFAFAQGGYLSELRFYSDIAATVDCRVPVCHRTEYRPEDLEFALLMEDIVGAGPADQIAGLHPDQIELTIAQAARLHAPRYGDPTLSTALSSDSATGGASEFAEFVEVAYAASVEVMVDRLGARLDADVVEVFLAVTPHMARWAQGAGAAETVVHGDLRGDNLLFRDNGSSPELVVVDWQTVRPGPAGVDVAYLIAGSIADPAGRAALEGDLVASYLGRMARYGVAIDRDEFWRDYRLGSIWGLLITAVATMQASRTDRGDELFMRMAERHGRQVLHLEPLALLE